VAHHLHISESGLLLVGNQIDNKIFDLSFGDNLCFKYPNGSCGPILDIYIPRAFQWYKDLFNLMSFDPCNHPLKIWKSIEIPFPKVGVHLGVWGFIPSHFLTFLGAWNVIPKLHSWRAPLQALVLVTSLRLGLRQCSYVDDTIEGGPMMWLSFAMDGNRQEKKWLIMEHKTSKWVNADSAPPKGSFWRVPMIKWVTMTHKIFQKNYDNPNYYVSLVIFQTYKNWI